MKKLLILALVCILASAANATLSLRVNGSDVDSTSINVGEKVMLGIYSDGGENQYDAYVAISEETMSLGSWTQMSSVNTDVISADAPGWSYLGELSGFGDVMFAEFSDPEASAYPAGLGGATEFECIGEGDVVVNLLDAGGAPVDSVSISQVPEPLTIGLLGLGGLFIRRRKA